MQGLAAALPDQYAASCVLPLVAGVDSYSLEAGDITQEREQSAELGGFGDLHLVPADRNAAFRVLGVGDGGRFDSVAKRLAVDIEFAEGLGGREIVTNKGKYHKTFCFNDLTCGDNIA